MITYKTDKSFYALYIISLILIFGYTVFIVYWYFTDDYTVNDPTATITSENVNAQSIDIYNLATLKTLDTELLIANTLNNLNTTVNVSNSAIFATDINGAINSNVATCYFQENTDVFTSDSYTVEQYNMIFGSICVSYYGKTQNKLFKSFGDSFFSVYINQYPPAVAINESTYELFTGENSKNIVKNFELIGDSFINNDNQDAQCDSYCAKYATVRYQGTKSDHLKIDLTNELVKSVKMYNTVFFNRNFIKTGVFPNGQYMDTVPFRYDMYLPAVDSSNVDGYNQYGVYNSTFFELELDSRVKIFNVESKMQYYDLITPKFLVYNNFYGEGLDPKVCTRKDFAKYSYNIPDSNFILTNSAQIQSTELTNKRYISLLSAGYCSIPSFIINFKLTYFNNYYENVEKYRFCNYLNNT